MVLLKRILCSALIASAALAGPLARAAEEKPVNLIVTPKVGRVVRMKMTVKLNIMGMDMVMSGVEKETVKAVQPNGDVVLEIVDEGGTMSTGGASQQMPAQAPYTKTLDRFGKTKKSKPYVDDGFTTEGTSKLMDAVTDALLTDRPVRPNDTWQTVVDNPAVKGQKVTIKSVYLGLDRIDGKAYWKIHQTTAAAVNAEGGRLDYEFTEWIDPTTGATFKDDATVKGLPTKAGLMTMQMSAAAVKAGAK